MSLPAVEQLLEGFGSWVGGESAWKRKYMYSFATALQAQLKVIEQLVGDWMSEPVSEWASDWMREWIRE